MVAASTRARGGLAAALAASEGFGFRAWSFGTWWDEPWRSLRESTCMYIYIYIYTQVYTYTYIPVHFNMSIQRVHRRAT